VLPPSWATDRLQCCSFMIKRLGLTGCCAVLAIAGAASAAAPPTASHSVPVAIAEPEPHLSVGEGPSVAAGEDGWLVVYDPAFGEPMGRLVGHDGAPVSEPFAIGAGAHYSRMWPRVAYDGQQYVVAWIEFLDETTNLVVQRVGKGGELLGGPQTALMPKVGFVPAFDIESGPSGAVIMVCSAEEEGNACLTWREVNGDLIPVDTLDLSIRPSVTLDIAFVGSQWLAAVNTWEDGALLVRGDSDGMFLPASATRLEPDLYESIARVVALSDGFALVWRDDLDTRFAKVDLNGAVTIEPAPLISGNVPAHHSAHRVPDGFLLYSSEYVDDCAYGYCQYRRVLRLFSENGQPISAPLESPGSLYLADAALTGAETHLLSVWQDEDGRALSLLHDTNDFALTEPMVPISIVPSTQRFARSAPGPSGWLVAWCEQSLVRARLLDDSGVPEGNVITIASNVSSSASVVDVAGHADGWLVIWKEQFEDAQAVLLDAQGQIKHEKDLVNAAEHFQIRAAATGWTIALNHTSYVVSGLAVATRELSLDGTISEPLIFSGWSTSFARIPFDITTSGDGYRVWWIEEEKVHARDVLGGDVTEVSLPSLSAPTASWLTAAQGRELSALVWLATGGPQLATTVTEATTALDATWTTELVDVGGMLLLGSWRNEADPYQAPMQLRAVDEAGESVLDSISPASDAALSHARDDQALLTFTRYETFLGSSAPRLYSSVVTVSPGVGGDTGLGGDTGVGGDGTLGGGDAVGGTDGTAGHPSGGETVGGGETQGGSGGTPPEYPAGESSVGGFASGGAPNEGAGASRGPRLSKGCGCRAVGHRGDSPVPGLALLALVIASRRRRTSVVSSRL
jgi:MYXO-CTERM domain-containing protein